ncbi:MAG TPA: polysaccharide deacetylase family protein [Sulfuricurvum sp.]|nr:polysaccharide deacetylase family protein [Sulfuricurvum sp.]
MRYQAVILLTSVLSLIALAQTPPKQWGENVSGVTTKFYTDKKEIALTFDACGGSAKSSQYDEALIDFLIQNRIPATLFVNARWIDTNPEIFMKLASNPLFEIANHGTAHRPLSVEGKSIYGIQGTASEEEVIQEIEGNNHKIEHLTGKRPRFFRSGTAYYDEHAVAIARKRGMEIGGFSVLADAGATFPSDVVEHQLETAKPGDIIIAHMNHPEGGTGKGFIHGIAKLKAQGFSFVRLSEVYKHLIQIP